MNDEEFDPWWRDALCAELGSELFFLRDGEPGHEAKAACRLCLVRVKCLADACKTEISHGIFGGFGRDARHRITQQIKAGEDPIVAATRAIEKEQHRG